MCSGSENVVLQHSKGIEIPPPTVVVPLENKCFVCLSVGPFVSWFSIFFSCLKVFWSVSLSASVVHWIARLTKNQLIRA